MVHVTTNVALRQAPWRKPSVASSSGTTGSTTIWTIFFAAERAGPY
jgi:hypothetical protein